MEQRPSSNPLEEPASDYRPGSAFPSGSNPPPGSAFPSGSSFPPTPAAAPVRPARPRGRLASIFSGSAILALAALVAVGGVTFAIGRLTAPTAAAATNRTGGNGFNFGNGPRASGAPGAGRQGGPGGFFGGGGAGLTIRGTVTSITADTLTLTLTSGATVEIPLQSSTTYHAQTAGTKSDVQSGKEDLDQLDVANGGGGGGGAGGSAGASPGTNGAGRIGPARDITVVAPRLNLATL